MNLEGENVRRKTNQNEIEAHILVLSRSRLFRLSAASFSCSAFLYLQEIFIVAL